MLADYVDVGLYLVLAAGIAAILGHIYPAYIGFRGGQGVATAIGVFLVLSPLGMGLTLAVMGLVLLVTANREPSKRLFLADACGAPFLPLFVYVAERSFILAAYAFAVVLLIGLRNLKRLQQPWSITERLLEEREKRA